MGELNCILLIELDFSHPMGWDRHELPWNGMGWDRKICPMDKPVHIPVTTVLIELFYFEIMMR